MAEAEPARKGRTATEPTRGEWMATEQTEREGVRTSSHHYYPKAPERSDGKSLRRLLFLTVAKDSRRIRAQKRERATHPSHQHPEKPNPAPY